MRFRRCPIRLHALTRDGFKPSAGLFSVFPASLTRGYALCGENSKKSIKLFCIIEKSGARHGARRLWLIAIKSRQSVIAGSRLARLYSIIMCSAFRLFTLERIASRLNNGQALRRLTFRGFVFIILYIMYLLGLTPRALSAWLSGSSSAACPSGLSLEYAHIIPRNLLIIYSKKEIKAKNLCVSASL